MAKVNLKTPPRGASADELWKYIDNLVHDLQYILTHIDASNLSPGTLPAKGDSTNGN